VAKTWKFLLAKTGEKIKVDAEDYSMLSERSWRVIYRGKEKKPLVVTSLRIGASSRTMSLGQYLMRPKKGKMAYPRQWDNGLDYRKENIIICSMKERQRMLPKRADKTSSQFRGVSFIRSKKIWRARIEKNNKAYFLGDFESEALAARAYNKAAKDLFGELAFQNTVPKNPRPPKSTKKKA
jgi:AP2-like factor, euAP2 lineage